MKKVSIIQSAITQRDWLRLRLVVRERERRQAECRDRHHRDR